MGSLFECVIPAAVLLISSVLSASAQDPLGGLAVEDQAFLKSPDYLDFVRSKFTALESPERTGGCTDFRPTDRVSLKLLDARHASYRARENATLSRPEMFANSGFAKDLIGEWWEVWAVTVCGRPAVRGMVVSRSKDGTLAASFSMPGVTLTDPRMQLDTLKIVLSTIPAPNCEHFVVTAIAPLDVSQLSEHRWTERWSVSQCGQLASRDVMFQQSMLDGRINTSISVAVDKSQLK